MPVKSRKDQGSLVLQKATSINIQLVDVKCWKLQQQSLILECRNLGFKVRNKEIHKPMLAYSANNKNTLV